MTSLLKMIPVFFVKDDPLSSPLEIAAGKGHTEIVEKLISAGAVINYQNKVRRFLSASVTLEHLLVPLGSV